DGGFEGALFQLVLANSMSPAGTSTPVRTIAPRPDRGRGRCRRFVRILCQRIAVRFETPIPSFWILVEINLVPVQVVQCHAGAVRHDLWLGVELYPPPLHGVGVAIAIVRGQRKQRLATTLFPTTSCCSGVRANSRLMAAAGVCGPRTSSHR